MLPPDASDIPVMHSLPLAACSPRSARLTMAGTGVSGRERRVRATSACDAAMGQGFNDRGNGGRRFGYVATGGGSTDDTIDTID